MEVLLKDKDGHTHLGPLSASKNCFVWQEINPDIRIDFQLTELIIFPKCTAKLKP
jgi:hypothetical protein